MNTPTNEQTQRFIQSLAAQTGLSLESMLEPISTESPSGEDLKGNGVYSQIKQARQQDDPNLPMGDWKHNLKVADWDEVSRVALSALTEKTKDIQLMIWLLEAQIHKFGFAGIAPTVHLMSEMIAQFWQDIYPQMPDGDEEYRTNLIVWLNDKLQPSIRQLAITASRSEQQYCWADWEIAIQMEQMPEDNKRHAPEYVQSQTIAQAITTTPIDFYQQMHLHISDALVALSSLSNLLDEKCSNDAPSLTGLSQLLAEILETITSMVQHRGALVQSAADNVSEPNELSESGDSTQSSAPPAGGNGGPVNSREAAYRQLAEAAEYLMRDDPHSPVPYLILKGIEWGNLNTAELYQELFVQYQGQLNIFEILGLEISQP